MPLSPREEQALATLEDALRADDPALAAALGPTPATAPALPVAVRHMVLLCGALLVLIVVAVVSGARLGTAGTAAATGVLVVPWLVMTARSAGRAPVRRSPRSGRRSRATASLLGVGPGPVVVGGVVFLVALASLPPLGQAVLGLVAMLVVVPWLALRVLVWMDRGTPRS